MQRGERGPLFYSLAERLVLMKIKETIGLDKCYFYSFGAAPLKKSTVDFFASLGIILVNMYGMTESSASAIFHDYSNFTLDSCGVELFGTDLIVDKPDESG